MSPQINKTVLMSGAKYFTDQFAINALMDPSVPVNREKAIAEHNNVKKAFESAGIKVISVDSPPDLQDGIYTANWALVRNGTALMSRLPKKRNGEEAYALKYLKEQGFKTVTLPDNVKSFSGQGDCLVCGDLVFAQHPYRTSKEAHPYLKSVLGFEKIIVLKTKPERWFHFGPAKKNKVTGWPDSPTYDLDLALSILKWPSGNQKGLIAWCPAVFTRKSRSLLRKFSDVDKIEVSKKEAMNVYALNLVSSGEAVIMHAEAPKFQADIENHGLRVIPLTLPELKKGGGSIRCVSLTIDN